MSPGSTFADHFSGHADEYARARPNYPDALFDFLAQLSPGTHRAWDCATGSGQAAVAVAKRFDEVIASDASEQQIRYAPPARNVHYHVAPAEASKIESRSIELVTIAQALHWFDFDHFYAEVNRVAVPGAILAAWSYELAYVTREVDAIIERFYKGAIEPFWPPERTHIETRYEEIPFPFELVDAPAFQMQIEWSAGAMLAYVRTWSSVKRYQAELGNDPVSEIAAPIRQAWGPKSRIVTWPLILKIGRVLHD